MRQIAVFSGKGGTGKTSLVASLATLARRTICVDADVDAANLALLLPGQDVSEQKFTSGRRASIDPVSCIHCGACKEACRFGAIRDRSTFFEVDRLSCEGCGLCGLVCPVPSVISFQDNVAGSWKLRRTATGLLVHAELGIAQDSSGKLVAHLRREAERLGEQGGMPYLLIDGPPGIGCPVHAAMGRVDLVVAVTEPSLSGEHDLLRLLELAGHFKRSACVVINKADLSPPGTARIRELCEARGASVVGLIPFDAEIPRLLARGRLPLDAGVEVSQAVRRIWAAVTERVPSGP